MPPSEAPATEALYLSHFGLKEVPFSIAPDPRYLYMSQRHQEALAHLLYGLSGDGGFVLLTGEIGAGKTTVCRCLLQQVPAHCDLAYIFNPKLTVLELLESLCSEFHIPAPPGSRSVKQWVDLINAFLLAGYAQGRHAVLIIDEAQNLSADVLEQMRLLTNLETDRRKLLQIILIGQPELAQMLARPELRQLAQRVVARYHLGPLNPSEVSTYVQHRLMVAGSHRTLFPRRLIGHLYRLSGGMPRLINLICDRALLGAYVQGKDTVDGKTLRQAAAEVYPVQSGQTGQTTPGWRQRTQSVFALLGGLALLGVLAGGLAWRQGWLGRETAPEPVAAAPAAPVNRPLPISPPPPAPTPPEKPEALPPAADHLPWPATMTASESREHAFAQLYAAWGVAYPAQGECRVNLALRCRTGRGGLDDLRQINRPAILYLVRPDGQEFLATLRTLNDDRANFYLDGLSHTLALDSLARLWTGRYTLLWRAPPVALERLRPGASGPGVAWLAAQLAKARGEPPPPGERPVFDALLQQQLRQFQFAQGLAPDGQLGQQTLIRLSSVGDADAPTLRPTSR